MACYLNERKTRSVRPAQIDLKPLVLPPPGSLKPGDPQDESPLPERMVTFVAVVGGLIAVLAIAASLLGLLGPN
jgi:hypothetical protein